MIRKEIIKKKKNVGTEKIAREATVDFKRRCSSVPRVVAPRVAHELEAKTWWSLGTRFVRSSTDAQ